MAGLGTTGTFTGVARRLKAHDPGIRVVELQPESALHGLEGWKDLQTALVPAIYQPGLADERRIVATEDAHALIRTVARRFGLLLSPSAAANLTGAIQVARELAEGTVVTVFPDNADKYSEVLDHLFNT